MGSEGQRLLQDRSVYASVNRALWALAPLLVLLLALGTALMQTARQRAEAVLDRVIAAENHRYCEKWGMPAATPQHEICVRDLVGIRARTEQRLFDELGAVDF